jgi:hypothetical protein
MIFGEQNQSLDSHAVYLRLLGLLISSATASKKLCDSSTKLPSTLGKILSWLSPMPVSCQHVNFDYVPRVCNDRRKMASELKFAGTRLSIKGVESGAGDALAACLARVVIGSNRH